ncbi:MAG: hypothetical protein HC821_02325 [Lewinella sp.]|nr:hypothetical protein [Lewinella sp.]
MTAYHATEQGAPAADEQQPAGHEAAAGGEAHSPAAEGHDDQAAYSASDSTAHGESHTEEGHGATNHSQTHSTEAHGEEHGMAHEGGAGHHGGGHEFPPRYVEFRMGWMLPGFLEVGTFLGFLGGFLFFVLGRLEKAPLEPRQDPYLDESKHHHT